MIDKKYFHGLSVLIGTIIGVGVFGLPYIIQKSGVINGIVVFAILTYVMTMVHLVYGEITLRTKEKKRLIGYTEKYLGTTAKNIITFSMIFSISGGLLAYTIVSGDFLHALLSPFLGGTVTFYSLLFFAIFAFLIYFNIKTIAKVEFIMTVFLVLMMILISYLALTHINFTNLNTSYWRFAYIFFPYGIILFALAGTNAIPEIEDILESKQKIKKLIIWGTIIPAILYLLFTLSIIGVTGNLTSQEGIIGLSKFLGQNIIYLGAVFGLLAVATSFIILGRNLIESFIYDYKMPKISSWMIVVFIPLFAYLMGAKNFLKIISTIGAIIGGIDGIIIMLMYFKAKKMGDRKPEYSLTVHPIIITCFILLFILGIIYQFKYWV